ncbi:LysR substrate-binding domain-containing protein [Rhodoferax sp.]|uniref:LysR family transcriptional regulator n=1 Tax=Rhodoferax sp. TaxID=50421 RepID=UPI00374D97FA
MVQINFGLDDLQAFVAVAEKSSFRAAAETLCLSQPALSRRIDKLETALGARLLERSTRRVSLTNVGRSFLEQARATLDGLENAVLRLADNTSLRQGLVTVACVPSVASHLLPHVLKLFAAQYPSVRLKVIDENANTVLASVLAGDADFGLNFVGAQEPDIRFEALTQEGYVLALRRDHAWAQRASVAWAELADTKMVAVSRHSGNRLLLDSALAHLARRPVAFYEANHVSGALGLVEAGLGLAALPSLALAATHPMVVGIPLVEPSIHRMLGLIVRKDRPLQPFAALLYEMLQKTQGRAT